MSQKHRIELNDSIMSATIKLADGNPGAISAMMELIKQSHIDKDSAWGQFGPLMSLDTLGIYGPNIWQLWKDVCKMDAVKVYTVFRAHQLGLITQADVLYAVDNGRTFNFEGLLAKIQEQLPNFAK